MNNIVAIEVDRTPDDACVARLWQRSESGLSEITMPFKPWLISAYAHGNYNNVKLAGDNELCHLHTFGSYQRYLDQRSQIVFGKSLDWPDLRQQFLGMNPDCYLFQGMILSDLVRMQIDIEATGINPNKERLLCIGIKCGDFEHVIHTIDQDEADALIELQRWIECLDPDIIEGHNLFGFDIPFIMRRAEILTDQGEGGFGIEAALAWGRDGSLIYAEPKPRNFRIGSFDRPVTAVRCYGRHIVDSYLVAARYDANTGGNFESLSLKYLAEEMGVKRDERIVIPPEQIGTWYESQPDLVEMYCLQDVQETADIVSKMVEPEFFLTTLLPDTFQNVLLTGGGLKVNQLLCSRYLQERHSIPACGRDKTDYEGGAVECRQVGVFRNVVKADVASLYPTIMLTVPEARPRKDSIGVFHLTLKELTEKRLAAKARAQEAEGDEKTFLTGIEKSYKILINSFYGYLACGMNFSDQKAAAKVTETGREIVNTMADQLEAYDAGVIEIDTDGVYFTLPEGFEPEWVLAIFDLPPGVKVEIEKQYAAMISVKAKNYVLVPEKGEHKYHGNSLRSRRDEKFGKDFIVQVVQVLLMDKPEYIVPMYTEALDKILLGRMPGEALMKRERITDAVLESDAKRRVRAAMGENDVEGDYIYVYQKEDGSLAQMAAFVGDYDRYHYWGRLYKFAMRLEPLLEQYGITLLKPSKKAYKERMPLYEHAA